MESVSSIISSIGIQEWIESISDEEWEERAAAWEKTEQRRIKTETETRLSRMINSGFDRKLIERVDLKRDNPEMHEDITKGSNPYNFVFWGDYGTGKTHTAVSIAKWLIVNRDYNSIMIDDVAIAEIATKQKWGKEHRQDVYSVDLLIIEDCNARPYSEEMRACLNGIICNRADRGRSTIVTTNVKFSQMLESRTIDRIRSSFKAVKFSGKSRR
jgi:DNA replication protein DnaC